MNDWWILEVAKFDKSQFAKKNSPGEQNLIKCYQHLVQWQRILVLYILYKLAWRQTCTLMILLWKETTRDNRLNFLFQLKLWFIRIWSPTWIEIRKWSKNVAWSYQVHSTNKLSSHLFITSDWLLIPVGLLTLTFYYNHTLQVETETV